MEGEKRGQMERFEFGRSCISFIFASHTVAVAQLVRASDCGSEGRGFETPQSP